MSPGEQLHGFRPWLPMAMSTRMAVRLPHVPFYVMVPSAPEAKALVQGVFDEPR